MGKAGTSRRRLRILACLFLSSTAAFSPTLLPKNAVDSFKVKSLAVTKLEDECDEPDGSRRQLFFGAFVAGTLSAGGFPERALAFNGKSRSVGYSVQKKDSEWRSSLSPSQYDILRQGATESPNSSILESEEREGTYVCAGCGTKLFDSKEKFHSGTGWPSFARAYEGVEVEDVSAAVASLMGAELRCRTCGGHLGDVFQDGFLFVGTPAFKSGKRYCIDGAALVFEPASGEAPVVGDTPAKKSVPSWLEPPSITPRDSA